MDYQWATHRTPDTCRTIPASSVTSICPTGYKPVGPWEPYFWADGWTWWKCKIVKE